MDIRTLKEIIGMPLDENISINMNKLYKISIRTKFSASHGGNVSQHGTSIKIITSEHIYEIEIPTKSYLSLNKSDKALQSIKAFRKSKDINRLMANSVESFIYVNQAAILAYWYIPNDRKYTDAIEKYITQRDIDYFSVSASPRTDAQLEDDKRAITEFIRKELNDQTIKLDFGK